MTTVPSAAPSKIQDRHDSFDHSPRPVRGATGQRAPNHLLYVDSMRGVAVCGVIATHLAFLLSTTGLLAQIMHLGMYGVQLFYLVSALTLMMSMAKRNHLERYPALNFFIRRFFRIAPAFYLTILVYCLWNTARGSLSWSHLLLVMTFLNGWRPDLINNAPVIGQWSIAVEMTFYLVLPLLFAGLRSFRSVLIAWYVSVAVYPLFFPLAARLAAWEGFAQNNLGEFGYYWFPSQLPVFLTGMALYFIHAKKRNLWRSVLPFIPGAILLTVMNFRLRDPLLTPVIGVGGMIFVSLAAKYSPRIIVNQFFARVGEVSFSAYLCHTFVLILLVPFFKPHAVRFPLLTFTAAYAVSLPVVFTISSVSWRLIEKPGQRLGKLCIQQIASRLLPVEPTTGPAYANTRLN